MKANYVIPIQLLVVALTMIMLSSPCHSEEQSAQNNQKEKESYCVGYSFGRLIKSQGMEYSIEQLVAGTRDAYGGKGSRLPDEEMKTILKELEKRIYIAVQKQYQENSVKVLKEGEAFLKENSRNEGVVTLASGLQYKVLKEGSGPSPTANDVVIINYRGTLINGTEFDSSYSRGTPEAVSIKAVIPGWSEALKLMKAGASWQLFMPPSLGYGQRGLEKRTPPNSTLIFEIELLSIENDSESDLSDATATDSIETNLQ